MIDRVRSAWLVAGLVAVTGAAHAIRPASESEFVANPLRMSMLADGSSSRAFMGTVELKLTNNSDQILRIPYWQLPSAAPDSDVFEVFRNGRPVKYVGPMIKRGPASDADLITFQPYETKVVTVDLAQAYDLSESGDYSVRFHSVLQDAKTDQGRRIAAPGGRLASLESAPLHLWVDAGNPLRDLKGGGSTLKGKPGGGGGGTVVNGVSFVSCSSTQIADAGTAVVEARKYSENAKGYLAGSNVGARYTTWFGAYTNSRYATAQQHFVAIDGALDQSNGEVTIDCSCRQSYYAFVYPDKPYQIHVCKAFWTAPMTGTDSKAGTLIHETSHFTVVAGTNDHVYGQSGAKNLALTDPDSALDNADNHEYFAENNPFQN